MPSASLSVVSSSSGTRPSSANTIAVMGTCGGTDYTVYDCTSETAAIAAGVAGPAVELACAILRTARGPRPRVLLIPLDATVAGVWSAVTAPAGSPPAITVTGTPVDTILGALKIVKGGALGTAQGRVANDYRIAADGTDLSTWGSVFELSAPPQATLTGTVPLSGVTLSTLTTTTLILTADVGGAQTVTFTLPANVADIAAQVNTQTTNMTATIENDRLVIKSDTQGAASTLSINATSTGDLIVGLVGSATSTDSTYTQPSTGAILGFAVGTYVLDHVYTYTGTQPHFTTTETDLGYAALQQSGIRFGLVVIANECSDAANTLAIATAVQAQMATMQTTYKQPAEALIGYRPSVSDTLIKNAITSAFVARRVTVCGRGAYMPGTVIKGNIVRGAHYVAAMRAATGRFSSDLGNGEDNALDEVVALAGAASTQIDEFGATIKLRDYRFTVLETRAGLEGFYFSRGITMAPSDEVYTDLNMCRLADEGARIVQPKLDRLVNADFALKADGTLDEAEAAAREKVFQKALKIGLIDPDPAHASAVVARVDRANVIGTNNNLVVAFTIQKKGQAKSVTATLGVVSALEES